MPGCVAADLTRSLTGSGLLTLRGVVFVLVRRSGLRRALGAHYAELARLADTSAMAAFAPALIPMLATPPARMFAATNMLVCVLLLLHFCSELLCVPLQRDVHTATTIIPSIGDDNPRPTRPHLATCMSSVTSSIALLGVHNTYVYNPPLRVQEEVLKYKGILLASQRESLLSRAPAIC